MVTTQKAPQRSTAAVLLLVALLLLAVSALPTPLFAAEAPALSPGVHLVDRFPGGALGEFLDSANAPIFSPDGKHLYFSRLSDLEIAILIG